MTIGLRIPLQQAPLESKKLTRNVFLYQDPIGDKKIFAQCGSCMMFVSNKQRCAILGTTLKVTKEASCNLYIHGKPHDQPIVESVTPEVAGFVVRKVRCENCRAFDGEDTCGLYQMLNDLTPEKFDLNETVDPYGCCTANKKKDS